MYYDNNDDDGDTGRLHHPSLSRGDNEGTLPRELGSLVPTPGSCYPGPIIPASSAPVLGLPSSNKLFLLGHLCDSFEGGERAMGI